MSAPSKPHDVGNGLVCASFGSAGQWLSLATVDPDVGFVELTGLPLFDPRWRGDLDAVTRYRSWMRRDEHAFLHVEAGRASISTRQDAPRSTRGLVQRLVFQASLADRPAGIRIRFNGRISAPVLAQVNEVDPATETIAPTVLKTSEGTLQVEGHGPPVIVQAWLRHGEPGSADRRADSRVAWKLMSRRMPTAVAWIDWPDASQEVHVDIACTFDLPAPETPDSLAGHAPAPPSEAEASDGSRPLHVPTRLVKPVGRINQRAASYARSCTALSVDGGQRTILADHRVLPLSRARDAYWQARLLLATWSRGGHDDDARLVADHLRWLFLRCERPDGRWTRSHHADGRRKDHAFAADGQLYPLLELYDFAATTGSLPALSEGESWSTLVSEAWSAAEGAIDDETGFIATEQTPADLAAPYRYLVSDQVLLWRAATSLAELAPALGLAKGPFATRASGLRAEIRDQFVVDGPMGQQWAYATDGGGATDRYMDANDLPVFLAPLWGFCKANDRAWRATVRFAFDDANPGYVPGVAGGLGSRHTPGTWTLGDVARWVAFGLLGEGDEADAALQRCVDIAFDDGMLPEAYDPDGSGASVRHWFAWPGALLGALVLAHAGRSTGG